MPEGNLFFLISTEHATDLSTADRSQQRQLISAQQCSYGGQTDPI
jgi:hypothetical protein